MSGFFAHATGLLGDEKRTEFDFSHEFSDDELLTLLERNPRVKMMCKWRTGQMFTYGIEHPQIEALEDIKFISKIKRAITFASLNGESLIVCLNDNPNLNEVGNKYWDFEVYHRLANGNGWEIKEVYPKSHKFAGQPSVFTISIQTEKMESRIKYDVAAERCIVFKNPMLGQRWGGTPDSIGIVHIARLEELMLRLAGIFAMQRCESFLHAQNVPSVEAHQSLETAIDKVPLKLLSTASGILVEPKSFTASGSADDFEKIITILKKYMANSIGVSQSLMDGASEGAGGSNTLSSSTSNIQISYNTIKEMQTHWKPYIEELLEKIGYVKNFKWTDPTPDLNNEKDINNPNNSNNDVNINDESRQSDTRTDGSSNSE